MPCLNHLLKQRVLLHTEANCIQNEFNYLDTDLKELVESIKLYYKNSLSKLVSNTSDFLSLIIIQLVNNRTKQFDDSEIEYMLELIDSYIEKSKSFMEFATININLHFLFKNKDENIESIKKINKIYYELLEHKLNQINSLLQERNSDNFENFNSFLKTIYNILTNF